MQLQFWRSSELILHKFYFGGGCKSAHKPKFTREFRIVCSVLPGNCTELPRLAWNRTLKCHPDICLQTGQANIKEILFASAFLFWEPCTSCEGLARAREPAFMCVLAGRSKSIRQHKQKAILDHKPGHLLVPLQQVPRRTRSTRAPSCEVGKGWRTLASLKRGIHNHIPCIRQSRQKGPDIHQSSCEGALGM